MANLIIKSSADNLVLQGSDASPAITVGATGTTTFAENATLSGTANNLGTVTAGSIAGGSITSATTFPAGHVIQTTTNTSGTNETVVSTTTNAWTTTVVAGSITPNYSNSSIVVHVSFVALMADNTGDAGIGFRFKRSASGISDDYSNTLTTHDTAGANIHSAMYRNGHQYGDLVDSYGFSWIDDNVSVADTAVTYTLEAAHYAVSASVQVGGTYSSRWHIWFQEIKR